MAAVVISGQRYRVKPEEADKFGPFGRTFLAEGDSWMDASAWNQGSLPEYLVRAFNKQGRSDLIINISTSGHTLTRIIDMMQGDFAWWLDQGRYAGILFSASGNDFIDAARDPDPGQGLLKDMRGKPVPENASDCIHPQALEQLVNKYLNPNFDSIYKAVRGSIKNADTPIFLNCYDTPTARDAPAIRGISGPWLFTAYTKNGIDGSLWEKLTAELFKHILATITAWAAGREGVVAVPTTSLLQPADAGASGESGDWINEIHPNEAGWKKQAAAWLQSLPPPPVA